MLRINMKKRIYNYFYTKQFRLKCNNLLVVVYGNILVLA
jgi:hypothetical protein